MLLRFLVLFKFSFYYSFVSLSHHIKVSNIFASYDNWHTEMRMNTIKFPLAFNLGSKAFEALISIG